MMTKKKNMKFRNSSETVKEKDKKQTILKIF